MAKLNTPRSRAGATSFIRSAPVATARTHGGQPGYARDVKSELFLLAVTNMVGEDTFYESAGARDSRYAQLVREAAVADPVWTAGLLRWLRTEANLRSASMVGAAEFVRARLDSLAALPRGVDGAPKTLEAAQLNRRVIASVCQRADEPGELLAYWRATYGRQTPMPVKRGLADAVTRLYNERAVIKWDSAARGLRFADVIEIVHPKAAAPWQDALFTWLLDQRHHPGGTAPDPERVPVIARNLAMPEFVARRPDVLLDSAELQAAGMTWESALSLAGDKLDRAKLWTALIPSMGYMALLRNLRNFDQAGVDDATAAQVAAWLAEPEQVARSRQLPMRFLSAYRAAPSLRWSWALEQALQHSLARVPALDGHTLILVDRSGSMWAPLSKRSDLSRADAAAVFGTALATRCARADLVQFGDQSERIELAPGESVLRVIERFSSLGGTRTAEAVRRHIRRTHTRVVIVTDEQTTWGGDPTAAVAAHVPVYTWNLAGYRFGHGPSGSGNRHTFGGLTDAAFGMIPLIERGEAADWPWTATA